MSKDEIRQLVIEIADEIYTKDSSSLQNAVSVLHAEILNNVEEIITESLYQIMETEKFIQNYK